MDDVDSSMLRSHALEALKEFLDEQGGATVSEEADDHPDVALVPEDWRLSQFWYIKETGPPYLSKECQEKVSQTISFLLRPGKSYLLLLTGEVQKENTAELLGLCPCSFGPQHLSKLGNGFRFVHNL